MELQNLEAFLQVARERSFTRAAAALFLTQPSVTARIQALEQEIGRPLFERRGRTVRLTEAGEAFLPYAQRALELIQEGATAARETEGKGTVLVGATVSAATAILPDLLEAFRRDRPGARVVVRYGHSNEVMEMLRDGLADVGFVVRPLHEPLITVEPLVADDIVLLTPPRHPLGSRRRLTPKDLVGHTLISMQWGEGFEEFERWMQEELGLRSAIEVDGIPLGVILISRGMGVGFAPQRSVAAYVRAGMVRVRTVQELPHVRREVFLALRRAARLSGTVQAFVDLARRQFRSSPEGEPTVRTRRTPSATSR
ncbi:MAG: LysR family transcriptional regulator [Armatimonadota bacterium]|nr:LysR family transcriptional regulator [Armatimonadota bacterium]MDW8155517.1 LysR family transcriptional regulator [Armatimonadota bacterium]